MRKIKFRAKSTNGNEWVYGQYACNEREGEHYILGDLSHIGGSEWGADATTIHRGTLGQFTDVTDKDGNDIYEDDIVRVKGYEYHVEFIDGKWALYCGNVQALELGNLHEYSKKTDIKIIGNTTDNPELWVF